MTDCVWVNQVPLMSWCVCDIWRRSGIIRNLFSIRRTCFHSAFHSRHRVLLQQQTPFTGEVFALKRKNHQQMNMLKKFGNNPPVRSVGGINWEIIAVPSDTWPSFRWRIIWLKPDASAANFTPPCIGFISILVHLICIEASSRQARMAANCAQRASTQCRILLP